MPLTPFFLVRADVDGVVRCSRSVIDKHDVGVVLAWAAMRSNRGSAVAHWMVTVRTGGSSAATSFHVAPASEDRKT